MAFLRGVNVGGKNLLPMKELAGLCTASGCTQVRTYIQSGNVIFQAPQSQAGGLPVLIAQAITLRFGYRTPVILRSVEELGEVIRNNPFLQAGAAENWLHVLFLANLPDPVQVAALDPNRSPTDTFFVRSREIYLQCPNGVGNTKLGNAWFDSRLATISTGRNWRTVLKLFELAQGH